MCGQESETVGHFLVDCKALDHVGQPILEYFWQLGSELPSSSPVNENIVQLILDPSRLFPARRGVLNFKQIDLHRQAKRLCHFLHLERYQKLAIISSRKAKKNKGKDGLRHTST